MIIECNSFDQEHVNKVDFVAITTDNGRLDPIKYVDTSAPDFYKDFDIPIISIYIKVKDDFLIFYYLWVNEQGVLINDSNYIDTIDLTYGAFQGYKSSKSPSFGVCFNKVKVTGKKGETIRADIVFTPLYLIADDVIGTCIPRKIIDIGEKSGVGFEWAKLAALDFWLSIKTKQ
ncbi:hypothetical protein [Candidatus Symbiopectobacterium sp. PLON1]|uniref:hypothetical protein n=1 Tax=Candidatus Symbiopectobacterium sp. PLON1 TaxID=2794575 RepID=UPI0025C49BF7|nr:hypothetical protein [Candidatus Symbiopectobacterium sp. PLON1]